MDTKSILNPIFPVKKAQTESIRTLLSITLVAVLLLVTITALSLTEGKTVEVVQSPIESSFAENPELMIARRFGIANQGSLSTNPELSLARRFSGDTIESRMWVVNPELAYVRSHAEGQVQLACVKFLSANPELMSAHRYPAGREIDTQTYSTNPELMLAHRYAALQAGR